jgi:predicted LPLAT superfamily acyltransferase
MRTTATTMAESPTPKAAWAEREERGSVWLLRVMAWLASTLGRRIARLILHLITAYFVLFSPAARRNSIRYLRRALGREPGWADGYRHVHTFASIVLDRLYFARGDVAQFELRHSGGDLLDAALAEGRGAVMLGAHLGSFEALQAVGEQHANRPNLGGRVAMVMYPANAQNIQRVLNAVAPANTLKIITIGHPGTTLAIRDWLDGGGLVGMLGDRVLQEGKQDEAGDVMRLPFLGHEAPFGLGPLRLAMLLKRRVFFMTALFHGGNRYEVRFEPLADFTERPADAAARDAQLHAALRAYVAKLEALCVEAPYNWFNFHDFWNEDAPQ